MSDERLLIKTKEGLPKKILGLIPESTRNVILTGFFGLLLLGAQYGCNLKDVRRYQDRIQTLENEVQPFRILAIQKFGSSDPTAMSNLLVIVKDLERKQRENENTVSNLQEEVRTLKDPKTMASTMGQLSTREAFNGSDPGRVFYYYESNKTQFLFLKLKNAPIYQSVGISLHNPVHKTYIHYKPETFQNICVLTIEAGKQLPIDRFRFDASYVVDPNATNTVGMVSYQNGKFMIDGKILNIHNGTRDNLGEFLNQKH
ncbi:MAG: hypothetical protein IT581_04900 [Verrucomicrobiales bacterium]|nr:hypothetical protein [Verrucomicrobiales bacterium]